MNKPDDEIYDFIEKVIYLSEYNKVSYEYIVHLVFMTVWAFRSGIEL